MIRSDTATASYSSLEINCEDAITPPQQVAGELFFTLQNISAKNPLYGRS